MGGWSIMQNLDGVGECPVYVHPLVKRTESVLTGKSLEMCTESLGSETGSRDPLCELTSSLPGPDSIRGRGVGSLWRRRRGGAGGVELPPPLPSISEVRVEMVREGGRLVMRAVAVGPTHACFLAERGNGRLRLCFTERCVLRWGGEEVEGVLESENGETKYSRTAKISRYNEDDSRNMEMLNLDAFCVAT